MSSSSTYIDGMGTSVHWCLDDTTPLPYGTKSIAHIHHPFKRSSRLGLRCLAGSIAIGGYACSTSWRQNKEGRMLMVGSWQC